MPSRRKALHQPQAMFAELTKGAVAILQSDQPPIGSQEQCAPQLVPPPGPLHNVVAEPAPMPNQPEAIPAPPPQHQPPRGRGG